MVVELLLSRAPRALVAILIDELSVDRSQLCDRQRSGGEQADHLLQRRILRAERVRARRRDAEAVHVRLPSRSAHVVLLDTTCQERSRRLRRTAGRGTVLQERR